MGNCEGAPAAGGVEVTERSLDGIGADGVADEAPEEGDIIYSADDFPATLAYLNAIRARHNADPLEFDDEAAGHARDCVQAGMDAGSMSHNNAKEYGEGQCISWGTVGYWDMKVGIDKWMEEESQYSGEFTASHYTQIVWKSSTGIGLAMGEKDGSYYIAANFSPAGNQWHQYDDNVEADQGCAQDASDDDASDNETGDDGYQLSGNGSYYWKAAEGYDAYKDGYYWYPKGDSADNAQWYSYN
jgi:hypothetical protein|mmetsp:Transcript_82613/g.130159  ORF Transcript_82613/g.130159 Transcript_82613/m.130159 type:complete len:243 (+) Transcript_82613:71-799(+)|eukprot:CAMPEP_0169107706 /NCGR_PEP_ID=MMETSP1015-20121227/25034_1 /TAXON_ID=342587 /ORGANISM="Karlodinium micrum, Strain CCMP2283" /LENGTH=242 /DNA_ID=CAMNT_0009169273 /DNA_START=49 /DNA_END=777 /DNA_ORIENTATION=+